MELVQAKEMAILIIKTELTLKNSDRFKGAVEEALLGSPKGIIVDLSEVTYLNSSALGIIADGAMKAKINSQELVLAGIAPPIDEIFDIVKFKTFMKLFATRQEAEHYFAAEAMFPES